jgi:hypothetical protein
MIHASCSASSLVLLKSAQKYTYILESALFACIQSAETINQSIEEDNNTTAAVVVVCKLDIQQPVSLPTG